MVVVTGPRQSGKSTLLLHELPQWRQVSLEDLDLRAQAHEDPRGFLARHGSPLIIDEAQHAPQLFSYLQTVVDRQATPGQYVLSGSQNLALSARIAQGLAGGGCMLERLAFSRQPPTVNPPPSTANRPTVNQKGACPLHCRALRSSLCARPFSLSY